MECNDRVFITNVALCAARDSCCALRLFVNTEPTPHAANEPQPQSEAKHSGRVRTGTAHYRDCDYASAPRSAPVESQDRPVPARGRASGNHEGLECAGQSESNPMAAIQWSTQCRIKGYGPGFRRDAVTTQSRKSETRNKLKIGMSKMGKTEREHLRNLSRLSWIEVQAR
jgi:hypothetical protein